MKQIPLSQGLFALVDDEDFEELSKWKWIAARVGGGNVYAVRRENYKTVLMHSQILGLTNSSEISDHINRDTLNNTRQNLRVCTKTENNRNRGISKRNTTGYKGVTRGYCCYVAQISIGGKSARIGSFATKEEAARAYDEKARELHGEFACTNDSTVFHEL